MGRYQEDAFKALMKEVAALKAELAEAERKQGFCFACSSELYGLAPAPADKDAEIARLRKVMLEAWQDTDWLLIANEVYDMKEGK